MLFIWGRKRVMPVNINALNITETEYSADLNPVRAIVAVQLTVIEGKSLPMLYTGAMKEAMAAINLANIGEVRNVVIRANGCQREDLPVLRARRRGRHAIRASRAAPWWWMPRGWRPSRPARSSTSWPRATGSTSSRSGTTASRASGG